MSSSRYTYTREQLLAAAAEIDPDYRSGISGPGRYDGASDRTLTAALCTLASVSGEDDSAGDVDSGEHLARFGHYVLVTDSQGFVAAERFGSDRLAQERLDARAAGCEEEVSGDE